MTAPDEEPKLVEHLKKAFDEPAIARVWRSIEEERAPRPALRTSRLTLSVGAAVLTVMALLLVWTYQPREAPLALHNAERLPGVLGDSRALASYALDDGSRIDLSRGAEAQVVRNDGSEFVTILRKGKSTFDVRPGGKRRWTIEAGVLTVQVLGTRFSVDRDAKRVRVSVDRGVVLVRGERVPERTRRLTAGETIELAYDSPAPKNDAARLEPTRPAPDTSPAPLVEEAPAPARDEAPIATTSKPGPERVDWLNLARGGDYEQAFQVLEQAGFDTAIHAAADAPTLLMLADVARKGNAAPEAARALSEVLRRKPEGAETVMAAFTLGKLEQDQLGLPESAVKHFAMVVDSNQHSELVEDALARLVDALEASHARDQAVQRAGEYLKRFPQGRRRAVMERVLEGAP